MPPFFKVAPFKNMGAMDTSEGCLTINTRKASLSFPKPIVMYNRTFFLAHRTASGEFNFTPF